MSQPWPPTQLKHFTALTAIKTPKPLLILAWSIILTLVGLAVLLAFLPWVQNAAGDGMVTTFHPSDRPQNISAPVKGRIGSWHVHEGSVVGKGDVLLELTDNDPQYLERLELELNAARQKLAVASAAAETANLDVTRKQNLFTQGLSAQRDVEKAKIDYNDYLAKQASATAELAKVQTLRARQETQLVRAPANGTIIQIRSGDAATFVKEGDVVAQFIPADAVPAVELFIKSADAPLVQLGAKVRLEFEGWPAVQFSGWPAISVGSFGGIVKSTDPSIAANGKFRVLIVQDLAEAWPNDHFLRFGTRARGWILLKTVSLGYEWWRQLNYFPPLPPPGVKTDLLAPKNVAAENTNEK